MTRRRRRGGGGEYGAGARKGGGGGGRGGGGSSAAGSSGDGGYPVTHSRSRNSYGPAAVEQARWGRYELRSGPGLRANQHTRAVAQWLESMRLYKQTMTMYDYDERRRGGLACNSYLCVPRFWRISSFIQNKAKLLARRALPLASPQRPGRPHGPRTPRAHREPRRVPAIQPPPRTA